MAKKLSINPASKITVTKVKLTNYDEDLPAEDQMSGLEIGYSEELMNPDMELDYVKEHPTTKLRNFLAHQDLVKTFHNLRAHMALICEYSTVDEEKGEGPADADVNNVFVTQVTLTGHQESAGVVLTGFRLLKDGAKLNLNTPNIKYEGSEYPFAYELSDDVDAVMAEAMLALTDRKRKIVQAELFGDDGAAEDDGQFYETRLVGAAQ